MRRCNAVLCLRMLACSLPPPSESLTQLTHACWSARLRARTAVRYVVCLLVRHYRWTSCTQQYRRMIL